MPGKLVWEGDFGGGQVPSMLETRVCSIQHIKNKRKEARKEGREGRRKKEREREKENK